LPSGRRQADVGLDARFHGPARHRPALRPARHPDRSSLDRELQRAPETEHPHLLAIRDPQTLRAELAAVRQHYNTVRAARGIGYVTPDDEHEGRGTRPCREAGTRPDHTQRRTVSGVRPM